MKISFIGTSHGVPEHDRFCSCYMIESGGRIYMVDAGAPAAEMIIRKGGNVNDFRAMFTTHVHSDHTVGMLHLIALMNWYYKESAGDFFFCEQEQIDATVAWVDSTKGPEFAKDRIRMKVAKVGVVFEDENIKVEYIPTKHIANSYSILVTEGEKRVLFGGDFSWMLRGNDVPEVIKENIDLFICEMAHFTTKELDPYLQTCKAKKLAISHIGLICPMEDIEGMKGKYPFEVLIPNDGDMLEI